ncbi:MAG: TatD family hydrolase [Akkermansia sp.]|nr:TatD family hydrolase [Akkermansia sp.]
MKDYHTHTPGPHGGYLCAVTRADWEKIVAAEGMTPCFGVHPWHAHEADAAEIAFELDDWLTRYPQADVGESGLDAAERHKETLEAQRLMLHIHLGAAFRHDRMVHLHGVHAWAELLEILRLRARSNTLPRVLLHAWNGSHELAREFLKLGAVFSVGLRELSHPKAQERYARIPADKLFPETDDHPENWERTLALLTVHRMHF